jgi:hypothetical protein
MGHLTQEGLVAFQSPLDIELGQDSFLPQEHRSRHLTRRFLLAQESAQEAVGEGVVRKRLLEGRK